MANYPNVLDVFSANEYYQEMAERNLSSAKSFARMAESEIEDDFPLLRSHAVVGIWGALESMIEDVVIAWMDHDPSVLKDPKIAKIRIPFVEFQRLEQQDQLRFLVSELQRDLGTDFKSGSTKFEPLLGVVGLGGRIDRRVKDVLFEAQNLRNVVAHRGGIADRRFVANCPHLNYSIGDKIKIGDASYTQISNGLVTYAMTILNRCSMIEGIELFGDDLPGFEGAFSFQDREDGT